MASGIFVRQPVEIKSQGRLGTRLAIGFGRADCGARHCPDVAARCTRRAIPDLWTRGGLSSGPLRSGISSTGPSLRSLPRNSARLRQSGSARLASRDGCVPRADRNRVDRDCSIFVLKAGPWVVLTSDASQAEGFRKTANILNQIGTYAAIIFALIALYNLIPSFAPTDAHVSHTQNRRDSPNRVEARLPGFLYTGTTAMMPRRSGAPGKASEQTHANPNSSRHNSFHFRRLRQGENPFSRCDSIRF